MHAMQYEDDCIYVVWSAPTSGSVPKKYLVQTRGNGSKTLHRQWVPADTMGHLFEGLEPGATYKVRVRARNGAGIGPVTVRWITLTDRAE